MTVAGVVLAGGKSSRYGKPKMFEKYNNIPFYQHSLNALLNAGVTSTYIVTNDLLASQFLQTNTKVLIETLPHNGPLYAITFAMESIGDCEWFFILAADIPFVTPSFIKSLLEHTNNESIDAVIPITEKNEQPLLAIYHRRCLPYANELLANNKKSMRPLLKVVNTKYVHYSRDCKDFTNINYQTDWKLDNGNGETEL
ncbi:molybdenum cofactor guanylyltransferase [Halalkalibacter kiskunsagensis]|uniref:Probable molybdenum cofactor guanylyltransferase n=1 Tax=Halalkalibacter kiskunsagensis TaxID=1548599 RepID=A0ABV6KEQ8_9BACI